MLDDPTSEPVSRSTTSEADMIPKPAIRAGGLTAGAVAAAVTLVASGLVPEAPATGESASAVPALQQERKPYHDFYFTRAVYSGSMRGRWNSWATDFPKADRQFLYVIGRTLDFLDLYERENPVRLDDPALLDYPFLYALEVGSMDLTEAEVLGLRQYLELGGFLVIDDFWGTWQWENFEQQMRRVFPDRPIVELTTDHEIFHSFYEIDEIIQVPAANRARYGPTYEQDGYEAHVRGIFDDNGRLMVVINWNTDLGDAWEWSERPDYPFKYSNFAHKMGVNFIIYALTH